MHNTKLFLCSLMRIHLREPNGQMTKNAQVHNRQALNVKQLVVSSKGLIGLMAMAAPQCCSRSVSTECSKKKHGACNGVKAFAATSPIGITSVIRKNLPFALDPKSKKNRLWPARTICPPVSVSVIVGGDGPGPTTVRLPATAACNTKVKIGKW